MVEEAASQDISHLRIAHVAGHGSLGPAPKPLRTLEKLGDDYAKSIAKDSLSKQQLKLLLEELGDVWPLKIKRLDEFQDMIAKPTQIGGTHELLNGQVIQAIDEGDLRHFFTRWRKLDNAGNAPTFMPNLAKYYEQVTEVGALLRFKKELKDLRKSVKKQLPDRFKQPEAYEDYQNTLKIIVSDYFSAIGNALVAPGTKEAMINLMENPAIMKASDIIDDADKTLISTFTQQHAYRLVEAYKKDWAAMSEEQRTELDTNPLYKPLQKVLYIARWGELAETLQDAQHDKSDKWYAADSKLQR